MGYFVHKSDWIASKILECCSVQLHGNDFPFLGMTVNRDVLFLYLKNLMEQKSMFHCLEWFVVKVHKIALRTKKLRY